MSDPVPNRNMWMTIEENVDDVRAVLDAAGSDQAVIYGDTEGGLSAMMLAATDPEQGDRTGARQCRARTCSGPTTTPSGHPSRPPMRCPSSTSLSTAPRATCWN